MLSVPTTTITVYRGTTTDDLGDETDVDTVIAATVPAHFSEQRRTTQDPATGTPRVIRYPTCRVPASKDWGVQPGDRILDDRTGRRYTVGSSGTNTSIAAAADTRIDLVAVT
jgi:hypothetical protein